MNPVGRPTKYTPELIEAAKYYRDNWKKMGRQIPSNAGLAVHLKVRRETLQVWANEEGKEEFSNILSEIQAKQEEVLVDKGLDGEFNSAITKLVLGKHGYHEKVDQQHTGEGGGPIQHSYVIQPVRSKHTEEEDGSQNDTD